MSYKEISDVCRLAKSTVSTFCKKENLNGIGEETVASGICKQCGKPLAKKQALKSLTKVAAYARVSVDKGRTLHSLSAQVSYYNKLIQNNPEWEYAGVYSDEDITGTKTKKREGFKRMVRDALDGRIDLIVTKSVSRFARNTVNSLTTIRS